MPAPHRNHPAYNTALQFERLVFRLLDGIAASYPREANELAEYTNAMMRCFRRSNSCVGTKHGQHESVQAAVWMVEALIVLNDLHDNGVERALVMAAVELLERAESDLRAEGSLPPPRDSP